MRILLHWCIMVEFDPAVLSDIFDDLSNFAAPTTGNIADALAANGVAVSDDTIGTIQNLLSNTPASLAGSVTGAVVNAASDVASTASNTLGDIGSGIYSLVAANPGTTAGLLLGVTAIGGAETYLLSSKPAAATPVVPDGTVCTPSCVSPSVCQHSACVTPSTSSSAVCDPACGTGQQCVDNACQYTSLGAQLQNEGILGTGLSWFGTALLGQTPAQVEAWAAGAKPWVEGIIVVGAVVGVAYAVKTFWPKGHGGGVAIVPAGRRAYRR